MDPKRITIPPVLVGLVTAGLYFREQRSVAAIIGSTLIHSTRPYTEKHLGRRRFSDLTYLVLSTLITGLITRSWKKALLFTAIPFLSHKLTTWYYRKGIQYPSQQDLADYKIHTLEGGHYAKDELFSLLRQTGERKCGAYLYMVPGGFMVLLSANRHALPIFSYTHTGDGTDIDRLWCCRHRTLKLSNEALAKLTELGTNVLFDGANQQWNLNGIPPCIGIKGTWNEEVDPYGNPVDWEDLLLNENPQKHIAFKLELLKPVWRTVRQTPGLRGISFEHRAARFKIWMHERNVNALQKDRDELNEKITHLQNYKNFLIRFEDAARAFASGRRDNHFLQRCVELAQSFPIAPLRHEHLRELYRNRQADRNALINGLAQFFEALPRKGLFQKNGSFIDKFLNADAEFRQNHNLVRRGNIIHTPKLKEWQQLLFLAHNYYPSDRRIQTLLDRCSRYLWLNNTLRRGRNLIPATRNARQQARAQLDPLLRGEFKWFFSTYRHKLRDELNFMTQLDGELLAYQSKLRHLAIYECCEQDHPDANQVEELFSTSAKIKEWKTLIKLSCFQSQGQLRQTTAQYVRLLGRRQTPALQQQINQLRPTIIQSYTQLLTNLTPEQKQALLKKLECPRSYKESTGQIEYYGEINVIKLRLALRRKYHDHIHYLLENLESHVKLIGAHENNRTLAEGDLNAIRLFYARAVNFLGRRHRAYRTRSFRSEIRDTDTKAGDIVHLFKELKGGFSCTMDSSTRKRYCESNFLEQELSVLKAFYSTLNQLVFELEVPLTWGNYFERKERIEAIHKNEQAIASPEGWQIYKRIQDGGNVAAEIMRRQSSLASRESVHTSIVNVL